MSEAENKIIKIKKKKSTNKSQSFEMRTVIIFKVVIFHHKQYQTKISSYSLQMHTSAEEK